MDLEELGWNAVFAARFEPFSGRNMCPARVIREERLSYEVLSECAELKASIAGRLRHQAGAAAELPAVGDWVAIEPRAAEAAATIHPRRAQRPAPLWRVGERVLAGELRRPRGRTRRGRALMTVGTRLDSLRRGLIYCLLVLDRLTCLPTRRRLMTAIEQFVRGLRHR